MRLGLRARLFIVPVLAAVGLCVALVMELSPMNLAITMLALALIQAATVYWITRGLHRLEKASSEYLRRLETIIDTGASSIDFSVGVHGGMTTIASALHESQTSLIALGRLSRQYAADMRQMLLASSEAMHTASTSKSVPSLILPAIVPAGEGKQFTQALAKLADNHATASRKANLFLAVLQDIPDPLVVLDTKSMHVAFMNMSAERFYPKLNYRTKRLTLQQLFTDAQRTAIAEYDAPNISGPVAIGDWLMRGSGGIRICQATGANHEQTLVEVTTVPQFERHNSSFTILTLRDLTASREAENLSRRRQRQLIGQRLCRLLSRESKPALEVMRTQANLLSQSAKQLEQRERLLPKVQRILQELSRQELIVELLDWMGALSSGQVGEPETTEVRLGEVANEVADRLQTSLDERGNTLEIQDTAGWVLSDETWLTVLATGLIAHANQSCERSAITLTLGRRTALQAHDEFAVISVSYPGQALPEHIAEDIRDPFRRPESAVFDPDRSGGLVVGLAVVNKLASLMYGEFITEANPDGSISNRVVIPTRIGKPRVAEIARAAERDPADSETDLDAVGAWNVGGVSPELSEDTDSDASVQIEDRAPAVLSTSDTSAGADGSETVGSWFGGNADE